MADILTEEPLLITTSISIDASAEKVWAHLIDFGGYGAWNPLTPRVEGEAREGEVVTLSVSLLGMRMTRLHRISRVESPRMLAWTIESRFGWWLRGERRQFLEASTEGRCVYRNEEEICGLGSLFVKLFLGKVLRRSLDAVGLGLKRRVEEGSLLS